MSFKNTQLVNEKTIDTVSRLFRDAFDKIPKQSFWLDNEAKELINSARDIGLTELANEMEMDLK